MTSAWPIKAAASVFRRARHCISDDEDHADVLIECHSHEHIKLNALTPFLETTHLDCHSYFMCIDGEIIINMRYRVSIHLFIINPPIRKSVIKKMSFGYLKESCCLINVISMIESKKNLPKTANLLFLWAGPITHLRISHTCINIYRNICKWVHLTIIGTFSL